MPRKILLFLLSTFFIFLSSVNPETVRAQQPTMAHTIKLGVMTPPPTKTPIPTLPGSPTSTLPPGVPTPTDQPKPVGSAKKIIDLVKQIGNSCVGAIVRSDNISCVNNLVLPADVKSKVLNEFQFSVFYNDFLQCVGFIRAATALVYGTALDKGGHAIDYATNVPNGYRFIAKSTGANIKVDDIAIWDSGVHGHIAYVVQVYDNRNFQIAEANRVANGKVNLTNTTIDSPNLIGWLRKI